MTLSMYQPGSMQSEVERAEKAIEVSHGSAGDFSRSAASQTYIKYKRSLTCIYSSIVAFSIIAGILLPLFWYGSVPNVSGFMKKSKEFRLPVTLIIEIFLFFVIFFCIYQLVRSGRSLQRRTSYITSCSRHDFSSSFDPNITPTSLRSNIHSIISTSGNSSRISSTAASIHGMALRQILEELPDERIKKVQELARKFLDSGTGKCSIVPGKFNFSQMVSSDTSHTQTYKVAAKVLLVGDVNVGKTSIFHRLLYDQFSSSYLQTIGADLGFSTLSLPSQGESDQLSVGLQIWDIGGQEQWAKAAKAYYKDAVVLIPVADISNPGSLQALRYWMNEAVSKIYEPYVVLLLNKVDLDDKQITDEDINEIEQLRDAERFEVSAKTGANVSQAFSETVAKLLIRETSNLL